MKNVAPDPGSDTLAARNGGLRGFMEDIGIHVLLEVTLVGIMDRFLKNTVLSMLVGICIVEGCQLLWRIWRDKGQNQRAL
jgi:hypothetical protein